MEKIIAIIVSVIIIFSCGMIINEYFDNNVVHIEELNNSNNNQNKEISDTDSGNSSENSEDLKIIDLTNNNNVVLSNKCTFIKSDIGHSMIDIIIPDNTTATVTFIVDECNINSGYAIIILGKKGPHDGLDLWESFFFWKQNDLLMESMNYSARCVEFHPGTYNLFVLSDFGKWGVIIESDLDGDEYIYNMAINNNLVFEFTEYDQTIEDETSFGKRIIFNRTFFNVTSSGFLFRFLQMGAKYDGYGIQYDEVIMKSYSPNGEEHQNYYHREEILYTDENNVITVINQWDAIYAEKGVWSTTGSITLKTYGKPNHDNIKIDMYELAIYF